MTIELRNAAYNAAGGIDVEINHEVYGWIPFTASANDPEQFGRDVYTQAAAGDVAPYIAPPAAVPTEISPSQLFLQLCAAGFISEQEALGAATAGSVPAAIDALFSTLPATHALAARVRWARMTTCLRTDPLVAALAAANSLTETQVDQFFIDAAKL